MRNLIVELHVYGRDDSLCSLSLCKGAAIHSKPSVVPGGGLPHERT